MSYLPTYESDKFNVITEAEEIENEKDRIIKKFNFTSYHWNISSNSKKTNKSIDISPGYSSSISLKAKSKGRITQSRSSELSEDQQEEENFLHYTKKPLVDDDIISDETEKDLKSIVEKALLNSNIKLINQNEPPNAIPNENEAIYNKSIYTFTPSQIQPMKENSYRKKVEAIFKKANPYLHCEISNRDMFNKPKILTNYLNNKREFRFIEQVNEKNTSLPTVSINALLALSDYSIYYLLSFCYTQYDVLMKHKLISVKLSVSLDNIFEKCFNSFRSQYGHLLSLQSFSFALKTVKLHKASCSLFDMIIKVKVTKQMKESKSYTLACSYYANREYYVLTWKIDVLKQRESTQWICCEGQHVNRDRRRFSYFQPILAFAQGDFIELHLSIFNNYYCINPFTIEWNKVIESDYPELFYQKSLIKIDYSDNERERCCEIENMIHIWKTKVNPLGMGFVDKVKRYFTKCFKICEVSFDSSSLLFYKFRMKAVNTGFIKKNFLLNFGLEVVDSKSGISNEIQRIGLMNINLYAEKYQIRIGSEILLYATELFK